MKPSRLYRNIGYTGQLLYVMAGNTLLPASQVQSVGINRGGGGLSSYTPATCTVQTPANLNPLNFQGTSSQPLSVRLYDAAAEHLAELAGTTPENLAWRFNGRVGRQTARDTPRGQRGTTVTAAAWSSILDRVDVEQYGLTPEVGMSLGTAAQQLFQPYWEPRCTFEWINNDVPSDTWAPPESGDPRPLSPSGLMSILTDRLHIISDVRAGALRGTTIDGAEMRASRAADTWPIARAQVLAAGATWEQPSAFSTIHIVDVRMPDDGIVTHSIGPAPARHLIEVHDWTAFRARSEQWHRLRGVQWAESQTSWHLPAIKVRVDLLLRSPSEYDRGVAGDILRLNVGDAVGLAGDWPDQVNGVHFVTGLDETITPDGWTITIALTPYSALSGKPSIPVKPVTWAQTRNLKWADAGPATWGDGMPPSV